MADTRKQTQTLTLSWKLHEVQREAFESDARYRTCVWGRRTGKNIFANADQVDYALNPDESPWGADDAPLCWWVGPTVNQSKKYGFNEAKNVIPRPLLESQPRESYPFEINLTNGATIEYYSFDRPDSLDGAGVDHIVVDEAAMMPKRVWDQTLRPMLSDTLGQAVFISKPKGKNWFHEYFLRGDSEEWPDYWSSQAASYVNPFVPDTEIDEAARDIPDRVFRQEYLALFLDDSGGVFNRIRERNVEDYDWEARNGNGPYVHGWDFARHQNWTVGIALDRDGLLVNFERLQHDSWPRIQSTIEAVAERYPGVVRVDASRDNKIVTDLEDNGVPIDAVKFTASSKRDLIDNLATRLEMGEITIPEIPQLTNELDLYEYETTPSGNVRYQAPEGWHDDCVDSLALAAHEGPGPRSATWGPGRDVQTR